VQKTASLYFCTPEELIFFAETECAKNRFALFLHSGRINFFLPKQNVQKTASLYFCTPEELNFFAETECLKTKQGVAA